MVKLMRVSEVTEVLAIGKTKGYDLIAKGLLPAVRLDGAMRVPEDALLDYIANLPPARPAPNS